MRWYAKYMHFRRERPMCIETYVSSCVRQSPLGFLRRRQCPISLSNKTSYHKISWIRSREIGNLNYRVTSKFDGHLSNCRACQIAERSHNSKYKSHDFDALRDLMIRRLIGYWNGALSSLLLYKPIMKCKISRMVPFNNIVGRQLEIVFPT